MWIDGNVLVGAIVDGVQADLELVDTVVANSSDGSAKGGAGAAVTTGGRLTVEDLLSTQIVGFTLPRQPTPACFRRSHDAGPAP